MQYGLLEEKFEDVYSNKRPLNVISITC